jgi:hypothetical protein
MSERFTDRDLGLNAKLHFQLLFVEATDEENQKVDTEKRPHEGASFVSRRTSLTERWSAFANGSISRATKAVARRLAISRSASLSLQRGTLGGGSGVTSNCILVALHVPSFASAATRAVASLSELYMAHVKTFFVLHAPRCNQTLNYFSAIEVE